MDVHDVVLLEKLFTLKRHHEAVKGGERFGEDTDTHDDREGGLFGDTNPNDIDARKLYTLRFQDVEDKGSQLVLPDVVQWMVADGLHLLDFGERSWTRGFPHTE